MCCLYHMILIVMIEIKEADAGHAEDYITSLRRGDTQIGNELHLADNLNENLAYLKVTVIISIIVQSLDC